jgi:hypothetical protein
MESKELSSIDEVRGRVVGQAGDSILERANYIRTLQSWRDKS